MNREVRYLTNNETGEETSLVISGGSKTVLKKKDPKQCSILIVVILTIGALGFVWMIREENTTACDPSEFSTCVSSVQKNTCTGKSRACLVDTEKDLNLLIPAYFYPTSSGELVEGWKTLQESAQTYTDVRHVIVINPNNGVDAASPPNADWQAAIDLFEGLHNVVLIGYVSTDYGNAAKEAPGKEQITGYFSDWSIKGIFFDETTGDRAMYQRLIDHTRAQEASAFSVFNFGSIADSGGNEYGADWLNMAELNIMYENTYANAVAFQPSAAQLATPRTKSALVLTDSDVSTIDLDLMYGKHFSYVYFVDRPSDYNGLMSKTDWFSLVRKIDAFPNAVVLSAAGETCSVNGDCTDNDCRTTCCSSGFNDVNCNTCSNTGACEACADGFYLDGGVCVAKSVAGIACAADGECTDNDCRTTCCSAFLNDPNCAVCDGGGFCGACVVGATFQAGLGCVMD